MRIGLYVFPTEYSIPPAELARAAEERGLESLFVCEHTHIPAARTTPWPGGSELPREYAHTLDPFVALTAAAAATSRLRVGTGICLVVQRDPIVTAKAVASLDLLSGGRVDFGVGAGWNREEMANHGTDPRTRMELMRERVEAMTAIWTADEASYQGRFVSFERIWSWPKPVQRPRPPVWVGGSGPGVFERVAAYGDGWMPIWGRRSPDRLPEDIAQLRTVAPTAPVTVFGAPADADTLRRLADLGVERVLLHVPSAPAEEVLPRLDRYAGLR
jgi:probable F420-dependent oxidoreductase